MKRLVVGLGEVLWDMLPEGRKIGGAPVNFAYHAGQFGIDTMAVSAIGNDKLGEDTIAEMNGKATVSEHLPKHEISCRVTTFLSIMRHCRFKRRT